MPLQAPSFHGRETPTRCMVLLGQQAKGGLDLLEPTTRAGAGTCAVFDGISAALGMDARKNAIVFQLIPAPNSTHKPPPSAPTAAGPSTTTTPVSDQTPTTPVEPRHPEPRLVVSQLPDDIAAAAAANNRGIGEDVARQWVRLCKNMIEAEGTQVVAIVPVVPMAKSVLHACDTSGSYTADELLSGHTALPLHPDLVGGAGTPPTVYPAPYPVSIVGHRWVPTAGLEAAGGAILNALSVNDKLMRRVGLVPELGNAKMAEALMRSTYMGAALYALSSSVLRAFHQCVDVGGDAQTAGAGGTGVSLPPHAAVPADTAVPMEIDAGAGVSGSGVSPHPRPHDAVPADTTVLPPLTAMAPTEDLIVPKENQPAGLAGLQNLTNTCYINSSLQCLVHTVPLMEPFLNNDYVSDLNRDITLEPSGRIRMGGQLAVAFGSLMKKLWQGGVGHVSPNNFRQQLVTFASQFNNDDQQDSQELLAILLGGLHEDLNRIKRQPSPKVIDADGRLDAVVAEETWRDYLARDNSLIVDHFHGLYKSCVSCPVCHHDSVKFDPFIYLELPVKRASAPQKSVTLDDCMKLWLQPEALDDENEYRCPGCKKEVQAIQKLDLWRLPEVLMVHLKRFVAIRDNPSEKIDTKVDFPLEGFDLGKFMPVSEGGTKGTAMLGGDGGDTDMLEKDSSLPSSVTGDATEAAPPPVYDLYAVSNHIGELGGGHYTAFCRMPGDQQQWYTFDDNIVSEMNAQDVNSSDAYVLFYIRRGVADAVKVNDLIAGATAVEGGGGGGGEEPHLQQPYQQQQHEQFDQQHELQYLNQQCEQLEQQKLHYLENFKRQRDWLDQQQEQILDYLRRQYEHARQQYEQYEQFQQQQYVLLDQQQLQILQDLRQQYEHVEQQYKQYMQFINQQCDLLDQQKLHYLQFQQQQQPLAQQREQQHQQQDVRLDAQETIALEAALLESKKQDAVDIDEDQQEWSAQQQQHHQEQEEEEEEEEANSESSSASESSYKPESSSDSE